MDTGFNRAIGYLKTMRFCFIAASTEDAQSALSVLSARYDAHAAAQADVIIALGGDGTMLETLHSTYSLQKPVYGINCGSVGFLLNPQGAGDLESRIRAAQETVIHPLRMAATDVGGQVHEALAFNEVSLLRETRQAAKLAIKVDGEVRIEELVCDGVLLSTPAGSTAYNFSASGPILPLSANVLALTPISAFRPRRWRGALVPHHLDVEIDVLTPQKRPVSATADFTEIRDVARVTIAQSTDISCTLLFDPDHNLEDRILKEQFVH